MERLGSRSLFSDMRGAYVLPPRVRALNEPTLSVANKKCVVEASMSVRTQVFLSSKTLGDGQVGATNQTARYVTT